MDLIYKIGGIMIMGGIIIAILGLLLLIFSMTINEIL